MNILGQNLTSTQEYSLVNIFRQNLTSTQGYSLVNIFRQKRKVWQVHKALKCSNWTCQILRFCLKTLWTFSGKIWQVHKAIALWTFSGKSACTHFQEKFDTIAIICAWSQSWLVDHHRWRFQCKDQFINFRRNTTTVLQSLEREKEIVSNGREFKCTGLQALMINNQGWVQIPVLTLVSTSKTLVPYPWWFYQISAIFQQKCEVYPFYFSHILTQMQSLN